MKRRIVDYGFGLETILAGGQPKKYVSATECAKMAAAAGYNFIVGYAQNGEQTVIAWKAKVVSREEALKHYIADGDKRPLIQGSKAKVWIILPVEGFSDILIPFEGRVRSFLKVQQKELV